MGLPGLLDVIPFVYLNFFITLGMALAISVAVGGVVRLGRVRGRGVAVVLGAVVGLATVLASHWWAYHLMLGDTDLGDLTTRLGFSDFMSLRTETGWKVASLHLTGAWTWIIWGIEAVTLVGGGVLGGWAQGAEPYCETCRGWAVEGEPIVLRQTPSLIETLAHTRDLEVLLAPAVSDAPDAEERVKYTAATCACAVPRGFLDVERERDVVDKNDKMESTVLHKSVVLGEAQLASVAALRVRAS